MPSVSILVPVYNVAEYLRQCLDSLIGQTLKDIEIICVDDGSTDTSSQILQEYAKMDSRVIIVNKSNGGLPSARNAGLNVARGKFVGFVDGDDYVDADMYSRMYKAACINKADIVVCGAHLFPDEGSAPAWLKDTLTTRDKVYSNGDGAEALFNEKSAKPFLWRDLISKSLIDKYKFRLDESVIVGEDQAFQFKIFPVARNVTFIPDKLYYYRYSRPSSLMNEPQYHDYGLRLKKHIHMIESILSSWKTLAVDSSITVRLFDWCVNFIYWDLIRVNATDRIEIAKELCKLLVNAGYYNYIKDYSWDTRNHFEYIYSLSTQTAEQPVVTVVAAFEKCSDYMGDFIDSILAQSEKRIEILLYENSSGDKTKGIIFERLAMDSRICLRLGDWQPISEKYNDAILTAKGKYICFLSPYDYIQDANWLNNAVDAFRDDIVDLVGYSEGLAGIKYIKFCQNANYRQFLYRVDKIRSDGILFKDYSLLIGSVFFTQYCLVSNYCCFIPKFMFHGKTLRRNSIYASEAKLVLRAFVWLLQAAIDNNLPLLAEKVSDCLNSENYIRLITDAAYGFNIEPSSADNPQEDFHTEILALLIKANELAKLNGEDKAVIRSLSVFVDRRHQFLEGVYMGGGINQKEDDGLSISNNIREEFRYLHD
ncbi:MAG: glycosyltransferase [Prevotella sp.]|nr:glycosyltransferase [Prevotella sp.]